MTLIATKTSLPIDKIEVAGRLRPVSPAGVATIVASLRELGQLTTPIAVRQLRRGGETIFRVLDGGHRLAAARELGWTEVPVRVFECTDDQARLIEIDGNLAGAELNPLDTAVFLATRKAVYERLHPETKAGVAGGLARQGLASELSSFADATAGKFGMTPRQVQKIVAAGIRLGPDEVVKLRQAPRPVTLKDLQDIGRISQPTDRYEVVEALAWGTAKTASAALKALQQGLAAPVKDPVDQQFKALSNAWGRAGKTARRRFIDEFFADLSPLLVDEAEKRDAVNVANLRSGLEVAAE